MSRATSESDRAVREVAEDAVIGGLPADDALPAIGRRHPIPRLPGAAPSTTPLPNNPTRGNPVHQAVVADRQWLLDTVTGLLSRIHEAPAPPVARNFVLLCDGTMAADCPSGPVLVSDAFLCGVEDLPQAYTATVH